MDVKFTICLTTYNRSDILLKSIENILDQDFKEFELFVIDDFSDKEHRNELEKIKNKIIDNRVKFIFNEKNMGLAVNRNKAIKLANGQYFTFKDDDDCWDNNYLNIMISEFEFSENTDIIIAGYHRGNSAYIFEQNDLTIKQLFLQGYTPPVGSQAYKTSLIKNVLYNESLTSGIDHDLWVRILEYKENSLCKLLNIPIVYPDFFKSKLNSKKMTTNYESRVNGIYKSLSCWESSIVNSLGKKFYNHFHKQYSIYLNKRFIHMAIKNKDLSIIKKLIFDVRTRNGFYIAFLKLLYIFIKQKLLREKYKKNNIINPLFNRYKL